MRRAGRYSSGWGEGFRFKYEVAGRRYQTWVADDSVSRAVFVPLKATELQVASDDTRLMTFETTAAIGDAVDQVLRVRVPETAMPQPVAGRVLDKAGRPVAGVVVRA